MKPLSINRRRLYLFGLVILFLAFLPAVLFFASGYSFRSGFGFIKMGGIFISVPYAGAAVSINGEAVGTSGIVKSRFYIDNLPPSSYEIQVTREGSRPWKKTLVVEENLVSDARALLIPKEIRPTPLSFIAEASTTKTVSRSQYDLYISSFKLPSATSTRGSFGESVFIENGDVFVRLSDAGALPPSSFCGRPSYCVSEIPIESGKAISTEASFFGGGVVYATKEGGIFLAESDIRPTPAVASIYPKRGAIFRVIDGALIIKDGKDLYEMEGL